MKNIYADLYTEQNDQDLISNQKIRILTSILNSLDIHKKNILDIGCYDGTLLASIRNKDNRLFGVDANPYAVKSALKKGIYIFDTLRSARLSDC